MPQSFLIGNKALETGGNLESIAGLLKYMQRLVELAEINNRLLYTINLQLSRMNNENIDWTEIVDSKIDVGA